MTENDMILLKRESVKYKRNKKGNPNMKKILMLSGAAVIAMLGGVGCSMCSNPIPNDPSCIENTHLTETEVAPISMSKVAPFIVQSNRQFRPVFRAGTKVYGSGEGFSESEALKAAVASIILREKCDYLVAVNHIATTKTHPTWRFFSTTNYTVKISGIPVYLDKLVDEPLTQEVKEEKAAEAAVPAKAAEAAVPTVQPVVVGGCSCSSQQKSPAALIRLTDIKVDVQAKGVAADDAGVIFPLADKK